MDRLKSIYIVKKITFKKSLKSIIILLLALIMMFPFILMISTSLKSSAEVNSSTFILFPKILMFSNYSEVFERGNWLNYFKNSIVITVLVTTVSLFFNSIAGFAFARLNVPFKKILFMLLMLGLLVPSQITLIPVFQIIKSIPLAGGNNILGRGGTGLINTYAGLMMPHLAGAFGVFLCRQFYLTFPKQLDDAAKIDGSGIWRLFFCIYLPQSKALLASLGVLKITTVWNDYLWPLVITNTEKIKTVQLALASFKNEVVEWEILMAATTVVMIPLFIVFLFGQKFFVQGIATSGMKG